MSEPNEHAPGPWEISPLGIDSPTEPIFIEAKINGRWQEVCTVHPVYVAVPEAGVTP
jgi:hypothetical protein